MRRLAVLLAALAVAGAAGVVAHSVLGPDPAKQAQADGCGRSREGEFQRLSPGWVYVGDKDYPASGPPPPPRWLAGVVSAYRGPQASHPSGGDDPTTHDSFDFNFNVKPDAGYEDLLGGLPESDTGNFEGAGEERDRIHPERELLDFPAWAWPDAGDHVQVMGSWVWDCGHWDPGGERTEIHPYRASWVERVPSTRSPSGDAEGDLYVSTVATPAGKMAECAHKTKGDQQAYKSCTFTQPDWLDVSGDYALTLRAPPRPAGAKRLAIRVVDRGSTVDPHWTATLAGTTLTLRFHLTATPGVKLVVARQVFLGWRPLAPAALPRHVRVTFTQLVTRRAMDPGCPAANAQCGSPESTLPGQNTKAPGEWIVYTDVGGQWTMWPRVFAGAEGRRFAVRYTTDVYVRPTQSWRLYVMTHECDFGVATFSDPSKPMWPCPKSSEFGNFSGDDVPGVIDLRFRGAAAAGTHRTNGSLAPPSTCPAKPNPHGCFQLAWRATVVRDERARAKRIR